MSEDPEDPEDRAVETYQLLPVCQLQKNDIVFMMSRRHVIDGDPWHEDHERTTFLRLPMRELDGTNRLEPPFERDQLVPVRVTPSRKRLPGRPYEPDLTRQDDDLRGVDINDVVARLRRLVGMGELVPPELVRLLDSWSSRGFLPPEPWRHGNYQALWSWVNHVQADLSSATSSARRLAEELHDREASDVKQGRS